MFPFLRCALVLGLVASSAHAEGWAARIVSLTGVATVLGRALNPGDSLKEGTEVRTGEATTLKLLLADDTIVDLGPNSKFQVERMRPKQGADREVTLQLDLGKARTSIQKKLNKRGKFLIRTKASVLAVRGTEVLLDVGSGEGNAEVLTVVEGRVDLSLVGTSRNLSLTQGQQIRLFSEQGPGGAYRVRSDVASNPNRFVQSVRQLSSMARQYQTEFTTLKNQIQVSGRQGDSTLRLAGSGVESPSAGPGQMVAGDVIFDLVPSDNGVVRPGGLNQIPGRLGGGGSTSPVGSGRNVRVQIIFVPAS